MTGLQLSHFGVVSCLGHGRTAMLDALRQGHSGLRFCDFETVKLATHIGVVDGVEERPITGALEAYDCRNNRLALMAMEQDGFLAAVADARRRHGPERIGVFLGTSTAGILETELAFRSRDSETGQLAPGFRYRETQNTYSVADFVQRVLGLKGPALSISTACSSSGKAFGSARRMIELGLCDAAIVGGADSLCLTTLHGFHSLQLVAEEPCRPFHTQRSGISIGEAAGFCLVERMDDRGGVRLLGIGESSDAHHMSSPHPEGVGARLAMEKALASAGLSPADIDYINLHGTATMVGDAAESRSIEALFGPETLCNSTKGLTGHTLGAAGILEATVAALALEHGFIPASPTTTEVDPELRIRYQIQSESRPLRHAMTNSFGFGGSNCSLVLGIDP